MKQIVQFIEDNNISEEEVAKAAHMSLRNFRRQIHSEDRRKRVLCLFLQIIIISPLIRFSLIKCIISPLI